jgi:hypothetical protein
VFRGLSKTNLPGYVGFFQFLRNFRQRNAFEQAELILQAALDPAIASRAKKGEFVKCFDHFDLLQTGRLRSRDCSRLLASELDVKVSLHPAQASRRPCDGPVSSHTTCWLYDTEPKSMPLRGR